MEYAINIIIDTDMAVDDWLAILYLLNHPNANVIGITVTGCGEVHVSTGLKNIMDLLLLAGKEKEDILVAGGDEEPLDGYHEFPEAWRLDADTFSGIKLPSNSQSASSMHAADAIISLIKHSPSPVEILVLGPHTNIAQAFDRAPSIKKNVKNIYIMGGAVHHEGNLIVPKFSDHLLNKVAEWNIYIDPLAARKVFRSGVPLTLVPLDVCTKVRVTNEFVRNFKDHAKTEIAKFIDKVFDKNNWFIEGGNFFFWDPLAAAAVFDIDLFETEDLNIDVVVKYEGSHEFPEDKKSFSKNADSGEQRKHFDLYSSGQTVVSNQGGKTQVCMDVNEQRFKSQFINIINL